MTFYLAHSAWILWTKRIDIREKSTSLDWFYSNDSYFFFLFIVGSSKEVTSNDDDAVLRSAATKSNVSGRSLSGKTSSVKLDSIKSSVIHDRIDTNTLKLLTPVTDLQHHQSCPLYRLINSNNNDVIPTFSIVLPRVSKTNDITLNSPILNE